VRRALALLALLALVLGAVAADAARMRGQRLFWRSPVTSAPLPLALRDPVYAADLMLFVPTNAARHMWEEFSNAQNLADTDGDLVGQIDDPSYGDGLDGLAHPAFITQWTSTARSGVLRTDATTRRSYVEMRSPTTDYATVQDSQAAFRYCHGPGVGTRQCTIIIWAGMPTDAASHTIADSARGSSSNVGFTFQRTAANRLQVFVSAGGSTACNHTTASSSLVAANGIRALSWRIQGNAVQMQIEGNAEETFTCAAGGSPANSTDEITIGGNSAGTGTSNVDFGGMMIFDRSLSDAELAAVVEDYRGLRDTGSWVVELPAEDGWFNFLLSWYNLTDPSNLWTNTAATSSVSIYGDAIAAATDARDRHNTHQRIATSSVANAPWWLDEEGAYWRGVTPQALVWGAGGVQGVWPEGGARTVIVTTRNDDRANMSTPLAGGAAQVYTGDEYPVDATYGWFGTTLPSGLIASSYHAVHLATGVGVCANPVLYPTAADGPNDGFNTLEVTRSGPTWRCTSDGYITTAHTSTTNNAGIWRPTSIGREGLSSGTGMHGAVRHVLNYTARLTDAQIARVREGIVDPPSNYDGTWTTVGRMTPAPSPNPAAFTPWIVSEGAFSNFNDARTVYGFDGTVANTNAATAFQRVDQTWSTPAAGGITLGMDVADADSHLFDIQDGFEWQGSLANLATGIPANTAGGLIFNRGLSGFPFTDPALQNNTLLFGVTTDTAPTAADDIDCIAVSAAGARTTVTLDGIRTDDRLDVVVYAPPGGAYVRARFRNAATNVQATCTLTTNLPTLPLGFITHATPMGSGGTVNMVVGPAVWGRGVTGGVTAPQMPQAFVGAAAPAWMAGIEPADLRQFMIAMVTARASPWDFGYGPNPAGGVTGVYGTTTMAPTGLSWWTLASATSTGTDATYGNYIRFVSGTVANEPAMLTTIPPTVTGAAGRVLLADRGFFAHYRGRRSGATADDARGVILGVTAGDFGDPAAEVSTFPGVAFEYDSTDATVDGVFLHHGAALGGTTRVSLAASGGVRTDGVEYEAMIGAERGGGRFGVVLYRVDTGVIVYDGWLTTNIPADGDAMFAETNASPCDVGTCTTQTHDVYFLRGHTRDPRANAN
jgi:hypothetical protein